MANRPILAMPTPRRVTLQPNQPPRENVHSADKGRQTARIGPIFERLEKTLSYPYLLDELRVDPSAIVPERALVFEITSDFVNFYRAMRDVEGFEFLGEDEGDAERDEDFYILDAHGDPKVQEGQIQ